MKRLFLIFFLLFFGKFSAQELDGAWKLIYRNGSPVQDREVIKIYQDDYFSFGSKTKDTNEFIAAGGGEYFTEDGYTEAYDFHTGNPYLVGQTKRFELEFTDERMSLCGRNGETEVWQKISHREDELSGNWVITGRQREGKMNRVNPGDRRTIKLLGGDRFQWVAFNSKTGDFFGTGGGIYSAENGKYTEEIHFFSRDKNRVGAQLEFDFEVKDGEWHHSGKSSKGDPMYEIWSSYLEAYKK